MPDSFSLNLSTGVEGTASIHATDEDFGIPLSGIVSAQATLQLPTLGNEFDSAINFKIMAGADTYQGDEATLLGGPLDRWVVYRNRLNVVPGTFGIPKLNFEGKFKTGRGGFSSEYGKRNTRFEIGSQYSKHSAFCC